MKVFDRRRLFAVVLVSACAGVATCEKGKNSFLPIKAVVIGNEDLVQDDGVLATVLVDVSKVQRSTRPDWLGKADTVHLQITARTKIVTLVGGKLIAVGVDGLVKGCRIEFRDYDGVQVSNPPIVSPGTVVITGPGK